MQPSLCIRACREEDVAVLDERIPCDQQVSPHASRYANQQQGRNVYLLAWLGDSLVGHLNLRWEATGPPAVRARLTGCPELNDIVVVPEHRSQGIGTRLIASAERIAEEQDFGTVCLSVSVENPRALALYERLGYVDWGHGVFEETDTVIDAHGQERPYHEVLVYLVKELRDQ